MDTLDRALRRGSPALPRCLRGLRRRPHRKLGDGTAASSTGAAEVAAAYFEAVSRRDPEAMAALWQPGGRGEIHGLVSLRAPDGLREWLANTFRALPDLEIEVLELIAAEQKAAVHWQMSGTFDGEARFEGMLATGARLELSGCDLISVSDGKIQRIDAS